MTSVLAYARRLKRLVAVGRITDAQRFYEPYGAEIDARVASGTDDEAFGAWVEATLDYHCAGPPDPARETYEARKARAALGRWDGPPASPEQFMARIDRLMKTGRLEDIAAYFDRYGASMADRLSYDQQRQLGDTMHIVDGALDIVPRPVAATDDAMH